MVDPQPAIDGGAGRAGEPVGGRTLTRSEERLRVDTVRVPFQRARLEKYLVTETRTVTVTREEVRVVYAPIDRGGAEQPPGPTNSSGGDAGSDSNQRWMTVSEEQVEVSTRIVPVARVRLETVWVDGTKDVTEQVSHEEFVVEPNNQLDPRVIREEEAR